MKRAIWITCLALALTALAWGVCISWAGSKISSGASATQYSSQDGLCLIEVIYGHPFTLIVTDQNGERRFPSSLDVFLRRHSVAVKTDSAFKPGWTSDWSEQIAGADYQVRSAADDLRIRIDPDGR
jgi:hypothetical protein